MACVVLCNFVFWICPLSLSHSSTPSFALFLHFFPQLFSACISINSCLVLLFYLLSPLIFPYPPPPGLPCPHLLCSSLSRSSFTFSFSHPFLSRFFSLSDFPSFMTYSPLKKLILSLFSTTISSSAPLLSLAT